MLMALTEAATVVSVDVVRAIDGDTLVVTVDDSLRKLRRLEIDAPEYDQDGGMAAVVRDWRTVCLLHDSIKYPPIDNRNDPPRLSKEVLSHAKKKEDHGLRCVQQWRIKNHDQTRRKSEDPAPGTR